MRLLSLQGRRSAALVQYLACRDILTQELGIEPEQATTDLYRQISEHSQVLGLLQSGKHNLPASLTRCVGRQVELEKLCLKLADHKNCKRIP